MPKITLTASDARDAVYDDHADFERVETTIDETSRWSIHKTALLRHKPTGKHYHAYYSEGATEMQDEYAYEGDDTAEFIEVEAVEVTVTKWVDVKE